MKTKLLYLLSFFFLLLIATAKAQIVDMYQFAHSAQYKKSYKIDSLQKDYTKENFILLFNEHESAFRSTAKFLLDSIQRTDFYKKLPQMQRVSIAMQYPSKNEEVVYTNLDAQEINLTTYAAVMPAISPSYNETVKPQWVLIDDFQKINNFSCKKAEVTLFGRKWTAWYSLDHPFPVGPYKFNGLPGIIIRIEDSTASYKFELYKLKTEKINYPRFVHEDIKNVTKAESFAIYQSGRYGMSLFEGVDLEEDRALRILEIKEKLKKSENNPLELIP